MRLIYPRNPTPTTPAPAKRRAPRTLTTPATFIKFNPKVTALLAALLFAPKLLLLPGPVATIGESEGLVACAVPVELGKLVLLRVVVFPAMSTSVIRYQVS